MDPRRPVLAAVAALLLLFFVATLWVAISYGPDLLTVLSLLIFAMLTIGVFGAFREPPQR